MRSDRPARGSPTITMWSRGISTNDSNPLNRVISSRATRMISSADSRIGGASCTPPQSPRRPYPASPLSGRCSLFDQRTLIGIVEAGEKPTCSPSAARHTAACGPVLGDDLRGTSSDPGRSAVPALDHHLGPSMRVSYPRLRLSPLSADCPQDFEKHRKPMTTGER